MKTFNTIFLVVLLFAGLSAKATIWRVNNIPDSSADFFDLQEAIDAASIGDTLYLEGNYNENTQSGYKHEITSFNKRLTVIGTGFFLTDNDSTYSSNNMLTSVIGIDNEYLYFSNSATGSVFIGVMFTMNVMLNGADNITFDRCKFESHGAWLGNSSENPSIDCVFTKCFFTYTGIGGYCGAPCSNNTIVSNCIFTSSAAITGLKNAIIKYNVILAQNAGGHYSSISGCEGSVIHNNITSAPILATNSSINNNYQLNNNFYDVFVGEGTVDNHFILKSDSPAQSIADDGGECGAFGGASPYVLSGLPPIPRIWDIYAPASGSATNGLPVIIKVKTQN